MNPRLKQFFLNWALFQKQVLEYCMVPNIRPRSLVILLALATTFAAKPLAQAQKLSQTISAIALAGMGYAPGQTWPVGYIRDLVFTASSGLPVTMTVKSGPAYITGSTIYITGPGTIVFAGNQAGNDVYEPAAEATTSWVISVPTPPNQIISGGGVIAGMEYTLHISVWSVSYIRDAVFGFTASSGLPVTMTIKSGPAKIIGDVIYITGPGTIVFAANQPGDANFNPAPEVTGSWTLTPSNWSTSPKKIICVVVDFPDKPGASVPLSGFTSMMGTVSSYLRDFSYGKTSLIVAGALQPVYRMPQNSTFYRTNSVQLVQDAEILVRASGMEPNDYDITAIHHGPIGASYWGSATKDYLLLQDVTLDGYGIPLHELGHSLGVRHAHSWETADGSIMGTNGTQNEYGDRLDQMGASEPWAHFNPVFKQALGWLTASQIPTVAAGAAIYRIYRFDTGTPQTNALLALRVQYGNSETFVLGVRRNNPSNGSLNNGLYVLWDYNPNRMETRLLDMTPNSAAGSADADDAALPLNQTFTDPTGTVRITPVAKGGTGDSQWMDVYVSLGEAAPTVLGWQAVENGIVLSWGDPSFKLQAAPVVTGAYSMIAGATSPYTNTFSEPKKFFRLMRN